MDNSGQGNALAGKLEGARLALEAGRPHVALHRLEAFVNQVEAFLRAGILEEAEGRPLIEAAEDLIARIEDEM